MFETQLSPWPAQSVHTWLSQVPLQHSVNAWHDAPPGLQPEPPVAPDPLPPVVEVPPEPPLALVVVPVALVLTLPSSSSLLFLSLSHAAAKHTTTSTPKRVRTMTPHSTRDSENRSLGNASLPEGARPDGAEAVLVGGAVAVARLRQLQLVHHAVPSNLHRFAGRDRAHVEHCIGLGRFRREHAHADVGMP